MFQKDKSISEDMLLPASFFLAGVATAIRVACFISMKTAEVPLGGAEHPYGWIPMMLACLSRLATLLLCGWVGLLLRRAFPKPPCWVQILLAVAMAGGMVAYGVHLMESDWLFAHFETMMMAGVIFGYLLPISSIKPHNALELVLLAAAFALLYAVCCILEDYQWVRVIPMAGFLYEMLLLAFTDFARRCVSPCWVQILITVLAVISFLLALHFIGHLDYFSPMTVQQVMNLLVQPLTVWLIIQLVYCLRNDQIK